MNKFTWQDLLNFVITLVMGYAVNILSDKLDMPTWLAATVILVGFIAVIVLSLSRKFHTVVGTYIQTTLRNVNEERQHAHKGLIVPLSMYNRTISEELLAKLQVADYSELDFEESNLAPAIKAIEVNKSQITHCWILATESSDPEKPGSKDFVPAMINYIKTEKGITNCEFHYDKAITIDDDALITQKNRFIVEEIFKNANHYGLKPKDIIADCTGGFKSITLGIFLACLDRERDILFIGTKYGENGKPGGPTIPIITKFSVKNSEGE